MVYVIAMYITNLSALSLYDFSGSFNFFHYGAIGSLLTLTVGFVAIVIYGANRSPVALNWHLQMMPWSYYGLWMAAIAESIVRGIPRLFDNMENTPDFWERFYTLTGTIGIIGFIFTYILVVRVRRRWMKKMKSSETSIR
jgi:hypothetical protein